MAPPSEWGIELQPLSGGARKAGVARQALPNFTHKRDRSNGVTVTA